jgi:hypothetical protein
METTAIVPDQSSAIVVKNDDDFLLLKQKFVKFRDEVAPSIGKLTYFLHHLKKQNIFLIKSVDDYNKKYDSDILSIEKKLRRLVSNFEQLCSFKEQTSEDFSRIFKFVEDFKLFDKRITHDFKFFEKETKQELLLLKNELKRKDQNQNFLILSVLFISIILNFYFFFCK